MSPAYDPTLGMARTSDPYTSHAARTTDKHRIADRALEIIRAAGYHGAITDDVHAVFESEGWDHKWGSTSKRIGELADAHRIELVGTRRAASGRLQQVWRVPTYLGDAA